ncbi:MAG: ABC transporter permease [Aestuariivita sp.]|nr:ABC transporter permease [Aestuariivita sp.]
MITARRLGALYFGVVVFYLIFPILIILPISFSNNDFLRFPPSNFGLRWYRDYLSDPVWIDATILSFQVAALVAVIATVTGTLAVLALARGRPRFGRAISGFIALPIVIPHIFIALGVFIFAVRFGWEDNMFVLAGAHSAIALPFVVLIVGASHRQLDPALEQAARVLGAGPVRAFFSAAFPSLLPAIVAGAVFAFFVSFDELIIAQFLMSRNETLPMRIWADLRLELRPTLAAVASLLIVVTTLALAGAELLRRRAQAKLDQR